MMMFSLLPPLFCFVFNVILGLSTRRTSAANFCIDFVKQKHRYTVGCVSLSYRLGLSH